MNNGLYGNRIGVVRTRILVHQLIVFVISAVFCSISILNAAESVLEEKEKEDLKKPTYLQDLAYGQILFDYYRGDEITTLTHILIAQKKQQLPTHANSAELLSGVIYLNLGMLAKAQGIFNRLLTEEDLKNELLAKIEFYLAKLHYKQRDYQEAYRRLSRVYQVLEVKFKDESLIMLSNIELHNKNLAAARDWLAQISNDSELLAYSRYNLGILWLRDDNLQQALPFLTQVYLTFKPTDVQRSLQDKAKVALGFYYLKAKQLEQAREQFLSVRLGSQYTNKALLGVGWTYIEKGDYSKALSHWLELRNKDVRDIAVQEALLAIPFAYQKLKAMTPALEKYLEASEQYQQQIDLISSIETQIIDGDLIENLVSKLIKNQPLESGDETVEDSVLFGDEFDYYIYELLAQNRFNEGFRSYQKLGRLALMLDHWEEQLPMFSEMLQANQLRFDERIPIIDSYLNTGNLAKYKQTLSLILEDLDFINRSEKLYLLATPEQTLLHQRIVRVENNISNIPFEMLTDDQQIMARRARGVLLWEFEQSKTEKIWTLKKSSIELKKQIAEMDSRALTLAFAREHALTRFVGYQSLIDEGSQKLHDLKRRIKRQIDIQADFIKKQILAVLKRRKATLDHFLLQSDLSVARLHEQAVEIPEIE